jgi:enoyl-CoA hydratase
MGHARHLILSGQNVDAQEAYRVGMVNKVVPRADLEAELDAWANIYLEVPRPSLTYAKRLSNRSIDLAFEQFVPVFDDAMATVLASEEHQAARVAWLARIAERQRQRAARTPKP